MRGLSTRGRNPVPSEFTTKMSRSFSFWNAVNASIEPSGDQLNSLTLMEPVTLVRPDPSAFTM